ncbi:YdeI/OmpD-associated family protein [Vagococcus zengguangii]|uniref:Uncharacterized protein n=1 Tax=Vagococcus zengguangii TaxID=2571750 RepID=A0A4D7CU05_9ENTE|nr:YdeI/OmpD-associated family protein [Vagococcus zengguangii]QCI86452.1 hypothetical protein FA707_05495 [Vagococcus zengguangii]TLG81298.1 hypothetical protein FE258_02120 [Vagococcus zengguangii]
MHTALLKKLRLKESNKLLLIDASDVECYFETLEVAVGMEQADNYQNVLVMVENLTELTEKTHEIIKRELVALDGRLLIVYPKKGNKLGKAAIHRDDLFPTLKVDSEGYIEGTAYKFNQMVSLDENYTVVGVKHVNPLKEPTKDAKPSQCVADYEMRIPELMTLLADEPEALAFYQQLTVGYQKGWARHVFSAKQAATQTKRLNETIDYLKQGVKAKHLAKK